ncbi:GMC oxidoreductase [Wenzhouxiangella sediminis]|uniref:GMC family oxidoreductase n=1 Tax=Wenzhouxiangella sediminis TaxID=1792836 RepID=A0A3E1K6E3_9GAMM|nr:GMC oxidoreductase [Wenzhouxiangella sediminis]RFF29581.1 GMC family oxidoreductase [Wenzhouxiangella sediminis]
MLHDLVKLTEAAPVQRKAQICIIGAGTAGLFLAQRLRQRGIRVVLLEAGGQKSSPPEAVGQQCVQRGLKYRGAQSGRAFGLGGTSALWGGQFIPLTPQDFGPRKAVGFEPWPLCYDDLVPFFSEVREVLGLLTPGPAQKDDRIEKRFRQLSKLDPDLLLRVSEWLPFAKRNFAQLFAQKLKDDPELEVWLNATVTVLEVEAGDAESRLREVRAKGPHGQSLRICAQHVVVSAGALESTRLILEMNESVAAGGMDESSPLGRHFSDHLSVTAGKFRCVDSRGFNHAIGPVFQRGIMRTPRLEISPAAQAREALTSAFAHFTFETDGTSGFDLVRSWLRKRQGEALNEELTPANLAKASRDMAKLGFWKTVHRRLWIPNEANLLLQVDIEQIPNWESRLTLADERDAYGRKRLSIDWRIHPEDMGAIRQVAHKVSHAWQNSSLSQVANLELEPLDQIDGFDSLYDVYHPTGTLRMGVSPRDSVVDKNLRLWGFQNCYISSTAVFPSAGSANPGFTHLALTARLAKHLAERLDA